MKKRVMKKENNRMSDKAEIKKMKKQTYDYVINKYIFFPNYS